MGIASRFRTTDTFKHLSANPNLVVIEGEKLVALQRVLLESLIDILSVCDDENVPVMMGGGTCLGAIRHKGFVPWDDDIDINMTRSGYERFRPLFIKRFGDKYDLLDARHTQDYPVICPQVRRKGTVVRTRDDFKAEECGACVDICIIENVPNSKALRLAQGFISLALGLLASCRRFYQHRDRYFDLVKNDADALKSVKSKVFVGRLLFFATYGQLFRAWDWWNSLCHDEDSEFLSVPGGRKHYFGEMYLRKKYLPTVPGEFEGISVPLPKNPEEYMEHLYGPNYMVLPPMEEREHHSVLEFNLDQHVQSDSVGGTPE